MRAYLPLLLRELDRVAGQGRLPQRQAFAVTEALRASDPTADEEDLEFEAMCQALDAARALGDGRRVIAAADLPSSPGGEVGAALDGVVDISMTDVVSFHVEESEGMAGSGYDDLLWYDVTELAELADHAARADDGDAPRSGQAFGQQT